MEEAVVAALVLVSYDGDEAFPDAWNAEEAKEVEELELVEEDQPDEDNVDGVDAVVDDEKGGLDE